MSGRHQAIFLPGVVLPAGPAYTALVEALGARAEARPKDLELYSEADPPPAYTLDVEVDGILREADRAGWERFHLVGYSGGGAASLAFAAAHPDRLWSLALLEPAWVGWSGMGESERAVWDEARELDRLPPDRQMAAFVRMQLRPGVEPPPPPEGPPPPWMEARPAGIRALVAAFRAGDIDHDALRRFERPVLYVLGALSRPEQFEEQADRLARVFPDFTLEIFDERHHFDPPHRIEPERLAGLLLDLWRRAENSL